MDTTDMLNIADVLVWNTGIFHIAIDAVVMSAIVFVHELGHYSVGRLLGAKIETFSIGLGRELAHRTDARGTRWRVAIFPIGGYVRFAARPDPAQDADDPLRADLAGSGFLPEFPVWKRAAVIAAGPMANFILAILIFSVNLQATGRPSKAPVIAATVAGGPAELAGLRAGDRVIAIDGIAVADWAAMRAMIASGTGRPLRIEVRAESDAAAPSRIVEAMSKAGVNGAGTRGIGIVPLPGLEGVTWRAVGMGEAAAHGVEMTWSVVQSAGGFVRDIFAWRVDMREMQGPPGVAHALGDVARHQPMQLFALVAVLSASIGIFNLLPVPVLDGGFLLFYLIEAVMRRPVPPQVQAHAFRAGFAIIASLMLVALVNDIYNIIRGFGLV